MGETPHHLHSGPRPLSQPHSHLTLTVQNVLWKLIERRRTLSTLYLHSSPVVCRVRVEDEDGYEENRLSLGA